MKPRPANATPPRRPPAATNVPPAVVELISRPHVAEILAALDERPHTAASLRRHTHAPRGALLDALRSLAAHHTISRHPDTGSWDATGDPTVVYQLTAPGHALINALFDLRIWAHLYPPQTHPSPHHPT